jgi:hypothetical protein
VEVLMLDAAFVVVTIALVYLTMRYTDRCDSL